MTKKIIISSIILMILVLMQCSVYAVDKNDLDPTNRWNPIYNPEHYSHDTSLTSGTDKLENIANNIIGPIRMIGAAVSVITLVVIGIRYILGSIEEKAEYKESMKPYLIGAIMVFGITNLLSIIVAIVEGFK